MSEIVGRRRSKWDLIPETRFPSHNGGDNAEAENGGGFYRDKESNTGWSSSRNDWACDRRTSHMEAVDSTKSKDDRRRSYWNSIHEDRNIKKGGGAHREEMSPSSGIWGREDDYTASMSPGLDSWRESSCSRSPRNKWSSRSHRSRSRSPIHGSRSESERWTERNKNGARGSNLPCKDFANGRCRRGSQCRFLHDIYDGGRRHYDSSLSESRGGNRLENRLSSGYSYPTNQAFEDVHDLQRDGNKVSIPCADFERGRCRRGSACKYVHRSSDDNYGGVGESNHNKREGFIYLGHDQRYEHEHRTTSNILCKFFASGRCRNGDNCKFSHGGSGRIEPEERTTDPWRVHNLGNENRLRDEPMMGGKASDKHTHGSPRWRSQANNTREEKQDWLQLGDNAPVKKISISPRWRRENSGISTEMNKDDETHEWVHNMGNEQRLREDPMMGDKTGDKHALGSPYWRNHTREDKQGWPLSGDNASIKKISNSPQWQRENETSGISTEMNKDGEIQHIVRGDTTQKSFVHVQTSNLDGLIHQPLQGEMPELHGSQDEIQHPSKHLPETELNKQTQLSPPGSSAVPSFDSHKLVQHTFFPQKNDQISALNAPLAMPSFSIQQPVRKVDEPNSNYPPSNPMTTATPSFVISDQVPQLIESVSLAQVLANGTNLSQLYASLSSLPSYSNSSNLVRPLDLNPQRAQKEYDPLSDSLDPVNVGIDKTHLPESSICIPEGKHRAVEESLQPSKSLEPLTVTSGPIDIDLIHDCSSEGEEEAGVCENEEEKQLEPSKGTAGTEVNEEAKEKEVDIDEDKEAVEEEKEEDKRSKSVKGARMFKFALVAFVKEILKPTWKEGHMSREAHKTIVKKVVEKVTSSMRNPSFPHTQENIDSYLSHSKPKVTKLVQAYVEKYSKT